MRTSGNKSLAIHFEDMSLIPMTHLQTYIAQWQDTVTLIIGVIETGQSMWITSQSF